MARRKPNLLHSIKDLDAANAALLEIADIRRRLNDTENKMNAVIARAKEDAAALSAGDRERLVSLENGLQAFAEHRKEDVFGDDKRSRTLPFGTLGFRKSSELKPVVGSTWKAVLENIQRLKFSEAVRIREDVNREELHKWPDDRLTLVGARRLAKDVFWYEIEEEQLQPAKQAATGGGAS